MRCFLEVIPEIYGKLCGYCRLAWLEGDSGLVIVRYAHLEEGALGLGGTFLHECKGVTFVIDFLIAKLGNETVSNVHDVLCHEIHIHANHRAWDRLRNEFCLNGHSILNHLVND